jgi:phenylalanyl-tRNA synthetase beta chain
LAEEKTRGILSALGLNEIMTYSLINEAAVKRFSNLAEGDLVELSNPLSEEQKFMTPNLLDGMLRSVSWNINRGNKDLRLFEIGKAYSDKGKKFDETPILCIGITGLSRENWHEGSRKNNFYDVKGIIEALFSGVRLKLETSPCAIKGMTTCAEIKIHGDKNKAGFLAEVSSKVLKDYDIKQSVYICQIALDGIYEKTDLKDRYHSITKFPFTSRDISILCDKKLAASDIFMAIRDTGEEIIRDIKLSDVYEGKQVPEDKKSLTFSIMYGLDTRTLKDEEVEAVHSQIKDALSKNLNVTFR